MIAAAHVVAAVALEAVMMKMMTTLSLRFAIQSNQQQAMRSCVGLVISCGCGFVEQQLTNKQHPINFEREK